MYPAQRLTSKFIKQDSRKKNKMSRGVPSMTQPGFEPGLLLTYRTPRIHGRCIPHAYSGKGDFEVCGITALFMPVHSVDHAECVAFFEAWMKK
jgi:hypothetical protein